MKNKEIQSSFFSKKVLKTFGGSLLKSNPKTKRTLSTKSAIHLVLKSEIATGPNSMLQKYNAKKIDSLIRHQAKLCGIKIYHLVNVGNHLHIVIQITKRHLYAKFIRAITGLIARHVLNKQRGPENSAVSSKKKIQFWIARPFTRIITWGRDFNYVRNYMKKNIDQANRRYHFIAWGFEVVDPIKIAQLNTGYS